MSTMMMIVMFLMMHRIVWQRDGAFVGGVASQMWVLIHVAEFKNVMDRNGYNAESFKVTWG